MSLKIVFMGTSTFAVPILESIYNTSHTILEVYTQPPKKKNRGQKIKNSPIHDFANKLKLPVRCPVSFKDNNEIDYIKSLNPDLIVVVAYGKIFPEKLLNLNDLLFINVHASLLPKWRGAAPIQRAIMNCDKETGISYMKIEEDLDSGPYMLQVKTLINEDTNYKQLNEKLSNIGAKSIIKCLNLIFNNKAKFINQDNSKVTYAEKIKKSEAKIIWSETANKIVAKINGLNPFPGAWFEYENSRFKIIKAKIIKENSEVPGKVLNNKLLVSCGENAIKILEIQKEGKSVLKIDDFLSGNKIPIGAKLI